MIKNLGKKEFLQSTYCHLFAIGDWSKYKEKAQKINKNFKTIVCIIGSLEKNTHILYTYINLIVEILERRQSFRHKFDNI